jgi:Ca-activated chloride channel family protein
MSLNRRSLFVVVIAIGFLTAACAQAAAPPAPSGQQPAAPVQPPPAAQPPAAAVQPPPAPVKLPPSAPIWPGTPPSRQSPLYPFMDTREDHLSTFAMDVDTASYTKMRDYVRNGQMPPADLVRIEEYLNYFKMDYPDPDQGAFGVNLEGAPSPFGGEGVWLVKVGIQGKHIAQ